MYGIVIVLAATGVYSCWCGTALIWDGAYQLILSLLNDRPYAYLTRFHSRLLWEPMILLSHLTDSRRVLEMAYGLPFTLAPAAGLLGSWWVVRRRKPWLIVWAVFGIAASPLPGQIFIINDSIFQQHMFWPVFLGVLVPLTPVQAVALAALSVFQLSHPIGTVLLAGGAGTAGIMAWADPDHRRQHMAKALFLLAMLGAAAAKIVMYPDPYAAREFSWEAAKLRWAIAVSGWPIWGLALMWAAGAMVLVSSRAGRLRDRLGGWTGAAAVLLAGVAGVLWLIWAADGAKWHMAIDYRRWVVPLTVPFYAMAFIEACVDLRGRPATAQPLHWAGGVAACVVAAVFAGVITVQSRIWSGLLGGVETVVREYPRSAIPEEPLVWVRGTPMDHWGMFPLIMWIQGKKPQKLLLRPDMLEKVCAQPPVIPYTDFADGPPDPGPTGWVDLREAAAKIKAEQGR